MFNGSILVLPNSKRQSGRVAKMLKTNFSPGGSHPREPVGLSMLIKSYKHIKISIIYHFSDSTAIEKSRTYGRLKKSFSFCFCRYYKSGEFDISC